MDIDLTKLGNKEVGVLLQLYYNKEGVIGDFNESDFDKDILHNLTDKNLISTIAKEDKSIVSLTNEGMDICGSVMNNRLSNNKEIFRQKVKQLPQRTVECLINRVMWNDTVSIESGFTNSVTNPFTIDQNISYERVLLRDKRISDTLEKLYATLQEVGFVENIKGRSWCLPEVEKFLKDEFKNSADLAWFEEDSLKYYFCLFVYALDQKNMISFSNETEKYREMFEEEASNMPEMPDPRTLLSSLGINEKRIMGFLKEMEDKSIVDERYYPLSSFSFFSDEDKIFVVKDVKGFMEFITSKFLTPVADSLLKTC